MPARAPIELEFTSRLATPRAAVWTTVSTMPGVNAELLPFVRMTYPSELPSLAAVEVVPGEVVFQSWLLAFGVLPFDRHGLALEEVHDGHGFLEESTSWMQRRWRHERFIDDDDGGAGCVVTDRLTIVPRVGVLTPVTRAVVRYLFTHRHDRLRRRFGAP